MGFGKEKKVFLLFRTPLFCSKKTEQKAHKQTGTILCRSSVKNACKKKLLAGIADGLGEYHLLRFAEFQDILDFRSVKQTADNS